MTNIGVVRNIEAFMKQFAENKSVQTLDLTDNEIGNSAGKVIISMMKSQAEKKDINTWSDNLRKSNQRSKSKKNKSGVLQ